MNIDPYCMAALYATAGVLHFTHRRFFEKSVPKILIYRASITFFSGVLEILIAFGLLFETTRSFSAWFLILFLIAVFPANIVQINYWSKKFNRQVIIFWLIRLPLQLILIYWAYRYT